MNYNTETIQQLAQQMAEMVKTAVQASDEAAGQAMTIGQIETDMRELLRQIGQQALGLMLSEEPEQAAHKIGCACGGELVYQRMREACVISVFGKVRYQRAYYAGCGGQHGKAPRDERYGLHPGAVTAGLADLLALTGIAFSYDESPQWLAKYLLFEVAENTVRCATEQMGERQAEAEAQLIGQCQTESYLQAQQRDPGRIVPRLYGSMDAAKVRIEPRARGGEPKAEHEDWRDMKVLCWYEVESVPPAQHTARHRAKIAREQPALRTKNKHYSCEITEAEEFGKLLWASGCQHNAQFSPELVFLGDGAVWIWNLVAHYYPQARQIVDWFHAEEHLQEVAKAAFSTPAQRAVWLEDTTQALWDGQVQDVIHACQTLAPTCLAAQQAVTYFSNNQARMRYDLFRAHGLMIGSGTIESACKQLVTHRLDLPGAQWHVSGAVQTAKARALWLSDQWPATLPFAA